jgi:hypothetical protein
VGHEKALTGERSLQEQEIASFQEEEIALFQGQEITMFQVKEIVFFFKIGYSYFQRQNIIRFQGFRHSR